MSTSRFQGRNEGGVLFCVEAYATTNTCAIILTRHVPSTRAPPFPIKKIDIGGSPPSTQNLADVPPHATAAPTRPPSARSRCALLATYHLPLMHTHTHTPSRRRRSLLAASPPRRTPHAATPPAARRPPLVSARAAASRARAPRARLDGADGHTTLRRHVAATAATLATGDLGRRAAAITPSRLGHRGAAWTRAIETGARCARGGRALQRAPEHHERAAVLGAARR